MYLNLKKGIIPNSELIEKYHLKSKQHIYSYECDRIFGTLENKNIPVRLRMLTGTYPHKEKGKITNEYSSMYDRSKYRFLLDAPFEISKKCCDVMKKKPIHDFEKKTGKIGITAQMASESKLRASHWLKNGCNGFEMKKPISNPMAFWLEQDVLLYIEETGIDICSVYGDIVTDYAAMGQVDGQMAFSDYGIFDKERPILKCTGCQRTGCMLCGFGCHLEKPGEERFVRLKETHPGMYKLLDVVKNNGVTMREAIDWTNEHGNLNIRY